MHCKKRGEITVFLSMLITVFLMLITALYITARKYVFCARVDMAADAAIASSFAEYNRELFLRYHIKSIDPSYKQYAIEKDSLKDHFLLYFQSNLRESDNSSIIRYSLDEVVAKDISYLSQNSNDLEQIKKYIEEEYPNLKYESDISKLITYALDVFGYWGNTSGNVTRDGEIEYLIYGMSEDAANCEIAFDEYEKFINDEYIEKGELPDFTYFNFLNMKIVDISEDILLSRTKNIISEYMRENGNPGFDWNECIVGVTFEVSVKNDNKYIYEMKRRYFIGAT